MPRSAPARISARVVSLLRSSSSATKPYPHLLQIHALMVKSALDLLPFPTSLLLSAAAAAAAGGGAADSASAAFIYARAIFRFIPAPNLFQYNTILRSYAALAHRHHPLLLSEALALFKTLMTEPLPLDQFPFVSVLKLSAQCRALPWGSRFMGSSQSPVLMCTPMCGTPSSISTVAVEKCAMPILRSTKCPEKRCSFLGRAYKWVCSGVGDEEGNESV
uniref:Pentatricopeptide repeat-containing protein n=1 Tax=Ananas comosus var. bracteatus TaxID=296719 RepID=A0A6V7NVC0_ANACO|nr:unnamed protein product [Ananas comosus var. bracteatus]